MIEALALYTDLLAPRRAPVPHGFVVARRRDGSSRPLPVHRWLASADEVDRRALTRLPGPVLDVGCGPGRHVHALAHRGVDVLGVDISPAAVALARGRGAPAIVASIFDELPDAGRWGSALLLDGNVGIGGDPARLLRRIARLIRRRGQILVELDPPGPPTAPSPIRLETPTRASEWFPWAELAASEIASVAAAAGLTTAETWRDGNRWFASLTKGS